MDCAAYHRRVQAPTQRQQLTGQRGGEAVGDQGGERACRQVSSGRLPRKPEDQLPAAGKSIPAAAPPSVPRYSAFALAGFLAGFAAGAAAFWPACAFFTGAFFAADGTGSASAVRSTTESSPPKSLRT